MYDIFSGNLFQKEKYTLVIPNYQRGYKWAVKDKNNPEHESSVEHLIKTIVESFNVDAELFLQGITVAEINRKEGKSIIIIDGQHRYVALQLLNDANISPSFIPVKIPEGMDILQYIAIRNSGKPWKNEDFVNSQLKTGDEHVDYIMEKSKNKYVLPFLLSVYTLDTGKLTMKQIKAMQGGYKKMSDFKKVVLTQNTQGLGDKICECCEKNPVLSKDRLTGRLGEGLKNFYKNHDSDINKVEKVLEAIDKDKWESYFVAEGGKSMETKAYENAFKGVLNGLEKR